MEPKNVQHFSTPSDFRRWLERNHTDGGELWVGYWKKGTGKESVTWPETVDEALCFGWIDGIRQRLSDEAYAIRFTPRRRGSTWSQRAARDLSSTVAPSDIRGLVTTGHRSVGELPHSRFVRTGTKPGARSPLEGSLRTVAAVTR